MGVIFLIEKKMTRYEEDNLFTIPVCSEQLPVPAYKLGGFECAKTNINLLTLPPQQSAYSSVFINTYIISGIYVGFYLFSMLSIQYHEFAGKLR